MSMASDNLYDLLTRYFRQQSELFNVSTTFAQSRSKHNVSTSAEADKDALVSFCNEIKDCTKCALSSSRRHFVFGAGNPNARVMLIGEAPGEEEDRIGEPFVGKAGKLLDKMLKAINFSREDVFITNILKCRPPGNRDPLPDEIATCVPYLHRQIELIKPDIILVLGRIAAQTLLQTSSSLGKLRTQPHNFSGITLIVTYHPAALLRTEEYKRPAWEDLKLLRKLFDEKAKI